MQAQADTLKHVPQRRAGTPAGSVEGALRGDAVVYAFSLGTAPRAAEALPKVLVLSASALVRFRVKKELKPRGFQVVELEGEGFANRMVRAEQPDVILIDTCATSPQGARLVRSLKDDPTTSGIPVLLFSDDAPESRAALFGLGADGVVPRRDDFDALAETLTLHLKR